FTPAEQWIILIASLSDLVIKSVSTVIGLIWLGGQSVFTDGVMATAAQTAEGALLTDPWLWPVTPEEEDGGGSGLLCARVSSAIVTYGRRTLCETRTL
ncbi:hypothetical protein INR49_025704, partial [Caranx melampygus]